MASYMQNLPESLAESARLDGANELTIYLRIIFPVSVPVFAAIAVFSAVGHWNAWFDVMIFNPDGRLDTLQVILRKILLQVELIAKLQLEQQVAEHFRTLTPNSIRAATAMIVTLPIVFSYPFLQKYFISGITLGSVKG
jgi:putative aldouronate transport system permease protein